MPESTEAIGPGDDSHAAGPALISPEAMQEIEAVLAALRVWLVEAHRRSEGVAPGGADSDGVEEAADLRSVVAEMIALRQEVKLQSRTARASREQLDEAQAAFRQAAAALGEATQRDEQELRRRAEQLVASLVADRDRLQRELDRLSRREDDADAEGIGVLLDVQDGLQRGLCASRQAEQTLGWRRWVLPGDLLSGMREGYRMSLERVSAVLQGRGVERIECVGRPADPALMRVLDAEPRDDVEPGRVTAEIRPGFVRNGRVVRYADVRVAARGGPVVGGDGGGPGAPDQSAPGQ